MALLTSILITPENEIFFILQISRIGALAEKKSNVEGNGSGDDSNSITIDTNCGVGDRNLLSRAGFLTFRAKIAFSQYRKVFIEALILHHF